MSDRPERDVDIDENVIDSDPIFSQVNDHMQALLAIFEENPKYAMSCFFAKEDEGSEEVRTYSGMCGRTDLIVDAMYVDLKNLAARGHTEFVAHIIDMIYHLNDELSADPDTDEEIDEEVAADGDFMKKLVSKTIH